MVKLNVKKLFVFSSLMALGSVSPSSIYAMEEENVPIIVDDSQSGEDKEEKKDNFISEGKEEDENDLPINSSNDHESKDMFYLSQVYKALTQKNVLGEDQLGAKVSNLSALSNGCVNKEATKKELRDNIRKTLQKPITNTPLTQEDIGYLTELKNAIEADNPLCVWYTAKFRPGYYPSPFPQNFPKDQIIEYLNNVINIKDKLKQSTTIEDLLTLNDLPLLKENLKREQSYEKLNKRMKALLTQLNGIAQGTTSTYNPLSLLPPYNIAPSLGKSFDELSKKIEREALGKNDLLTVIEHLGHMEEAISKYNPSVQVATAIPMKLLEKTIRNTLSMIKKSRSTALGLYLSKEALKKVIHVFYQKLNINFNKIANLLGQEEIWVLSLDGGGIKGIIGATMLDDMSRKLGQPIANLFDFFAGTSTGGLIALGLTTPTKGDTRIPAFDTEFVKNLYLKYGQVIFPPMSGISKTLFQAKSYAYEPNNLEALLQSFFGNQALANAVKLTLITTVNITEGMPMFFASYKPYSWEKIKTKFKTDRKQYGVSFDPNKNTRITTAARATSAAPSYFPPTTTFYNGRSRELIDGGVTTNNPTLLALQEIYALRRQFPDLPFNIKKINVVSIGTGVPKYHHEFGHSGVGLLKVLEAFTHIGMGFSVKETDLQVENYLKLLHKTGVLQDGFTYYRFNPDVGDVELDSASEDNIQKLLEISNGITASKQYTMLLQHLKSYSRGLKEEDSTGVTTRLLGNVNDPINATQEEVQQDLLQSGELGDSGIDLNIPKIVEKEEKNKKRPSLNLNKREVDLKNPSRRIITTDTSTMNNQQRIQDDY